MKILTTPEYWDCECEHNYIHHKSEPSCHICKAVIDEQPDSTVTEVIEQILLREN